MSESEPPRNDEALLSIERELRQANDARELLYGFVFLVAVHAVAMLFLLPLGVQRGTTYVWASLGGIGTLAVWFACAARPYSQRITRAGIAFAIVAAMSVGSLSYLTLPQQRQLVPRGRNWMIVNNSLVRNGVDSTQSIVLCWMFGAMVSGFAVHWFFGMQLLPPDCTIQRKPLSLQSIFLLMIVAAIVSLYIRGPNWRNRITYFSNGVTLGFVAAAVAFAVFSKEKWTTRIAIPLVTSTAIIGFDITVGGLTGMWRGGLLNRLGEIASFVSGLAISPALSFLYLKQLGYDMRTQRRVSSAPTTTMETAQNPTPSRQASN